MIAHLADVSIRSLILTAIAAAVLWACRKRASPALAHTLWTTVVCGMLALFALIPVLPPLPLRVLSPASATLVVTQTSALAADELQPTNRQPASVPAARIQRSHRVSVRQIMIAIYLITALILAARLGAGWVLIRRLLRRTAPTVFSGIYESPDVAVPITVGLLRSRILLPIGWREWSKAKLDAVLAHERAHIRRRDPAITLLARLNRCLFWFHPLAWWLECKLAALAEQACDDAVLSGVVDRRHYAKLLLEMASAVGPSQGRVYSYSVGMASYVHKRIDRVLEEWRVHSPRLTSALRLGLFIASVPVIYAAGASRIERQPALATFEFPPLLSPASPELIAQQRPPAPRQLPPNPPTQRQIRVFVTVTEPAGRYVTGLTANDFRLFENGVPQQITAFEDTSPVSLAVIVNEDGDAVEALIPKLTLLRQGLASEDELFFVYARGTQPEPASSIDELISIARTVGTGPDRNRSVNTDAVYLAAERLRTARQSRRILLAIAGSSMEDFSSHSEADAVAMAHSADLIAYDGRIWDLQSFLLEIHTQYVLTYTPLDTASGEFRPIEVQVAFIQGLPPLTVRARQGYSVP